MGEREPSFPDLVLFPELGWLISMGGGELSFPDLALFPGDISTISGLLLFLEVFFMGVTASLSFAPVFLVGACSFPVGSGWESCPLLSLALGKLIGVFQVLRLEVVSGLFVILFPKLLPVYTLALGLLALQFPSVVSGVPLLSMLGNLSLLAPEPNLLMVVLCLLLGCLVLGEVESVSDSVLGSSALTVSLDESFFSLCAECTTGLESGSPEFCVFLVPSCSALGLLFEKVCVWGADLCLLGGSSLSCLSLSPISFICCCCESLSLFSLSLLLFCWGLGPLLVGLLECLLPCLLPTLLVEGLFVGLPIGLPVGLGEPLF